MPTEIVAAQVFETVDAKIANDIKKFDPNEANIQKAVAEVSSLTITGLDDKEGIKAVERGVSIIRKMRTSIEKTRKECKEESLVYGRGIDNYAKKLTEMLLPTEEAAKAKLQAIDDEKEKIELARLEAEHQQLKERNAAIMATGARFDGVVYSLGAASIYLAEVKLLANDEFEAHLKLFEGIDNEIAAAKAEKERIAAEAEEQRQAEIKAEKERLAEQKRMQDAEAETLLAEKAEIERQKAEIQEQKDQALRQRTAARGKELEALGMVHSYQAGQWLFHTKDFVDFSMSAHIVLEDTDEQWALDFSHTKNQIEATKEKQAAFDLKTRQEAEEQAKTKAICDEAERLAQMTDKERLHEYLKTFANVRPETPLFESQLFKDQVGTFNQKVDSAFALIHQLIK